MSPRYEADIPLGKSAEYEKFVKSLGGGIINKTLIPEEVKEKVNVAWACHATEARTMVDALLNPPTIADSQRVLRGLVRFVRGISNPHPRVALPVRNDINYNMLRGLLGAVLIEALPAEAPADFKWDISTNALKRQPQRFDNELRDYPPRLPHPRNLAMLMKNYGLSNLRPIPRAVLATEYGINQSTVQKGIEDALNDLRRNPAIKAHILIEQP